MSEKKPQQKRSNLSVSDYEKLGRTLESIFEGGYVNHKRVYRINFTRGIFFGLGTFIGGTVVVAFMLWLIGQFSELSFLQDIVDTVRNSVD